MNHMSDVLDVVLPAHNESDSIARVLTEFYDQVAVRDHIPVRFVVCEDGSTDNTVAVLTELSQTLPMLLITSGGRKGYSTAVIDGLRATTAPLVAFIDSDGQCDPSDLSDLLRDMDGADLIVGYRSPRVDPAYRRVMSGSFRLVYRRLFPVTLHDPSCPFLVVRREGLEQILSGNVGLLAQGFWWEFNARAVACGLAVRERPIHHRPREAGRTKVYRTTKIPQIAARHLIGLLSLRRELAASKSTAGL